MTGAIIWLRVSDGHQNEDNQLPDLERWCAEHGYQSVVGTTRNYLLSSRRVVQTLTLPCLALLG